MICSLCLYVPITDTDTDADRRVAVINGQSVCVEHAGYVTSSNHARALALLVEQHGYSSLAELQAARS